MNKQIHELRTKIDGLAQLVKSLDKPIFMISEYNIPPDMTIDDIANEFKKVGKVISVSITPQIEYKGGLSFLAETYKSLLLAKAWLGKVLSEIGEETPYKNDGNRKTVEDIEPTADKFNKNALLLFFKNWIRVEKEWNQFTYIEKIDWLREKIKILKVDFNDFVCDIEFADYDETFDIAQNHLTESRFFLGFELQRLKEQSNK